MGCDGSFILNLSAGSGHVSLWFHEYSQGVRLSNGWDFFLLFASISWMKISGTRCLSLCDHFAGVLEEICAIWNIRELQYFLVLPAPFLSFLPWNSEFFWDGIKH